MELRLSLGLLVILAAASLAMATQESHDQVEQPALKHIEPAIARGRFSSPKIFDFEQYKRLFKKSYHSLTEEMVRRKLMLARAFRAWISAIKYKNRRLSYYLALNHMSDWTPGELDMMENKLKAEGEKRGEILAQDEEHKSSPQVIPNVDPDTIEENLDRWLAKGEHLVELLDDDTSELQSGNVRTKRDTGGLQMELRLTNTGDLGVQSLELDALRSDQSSKPMILEGVGARDNRLEEIQYVELADRPAGINSSETTSDSKKGSKKNRLSSLMVSVVHSRLTLGNSAKNTNTKAANAIFFDHRDSGCLMLPRHQGKCGSCWAFTAIAFAEWLHCQATGKLVAFSEQYLVDCGRPAGAHGCAGGSEQSAVKFLHNYGVELRQSYPYIARENQCPYEANIEPKRMGSIRMDLGALLAIPVGLFEQYIQFAPIIVSVQLKRFPGIYEYGGGVIGGRGCVQRGSHSLMLVGHGREEGQDYWLARNSWSTSWGEGGYFKLAKSCAGSCFENGRGLIYGTRDGRHFITRPRENDNRGAAL